LEEREKLAKLDALDDDVSKPKPADDVEAGGDEGEDEELLPQVNEKAEPPKSSFTSAVIWMVINTLATIGIVRFHPDVGNA
jgi:solute carrier family 35, member E3